MKFHNDRYWIIQELHEKKSCKVYAIEDRYTGKKYIAKVLELQNASPIQIHQFKMEVDVLSRLTDPHIPQLVEVDYDEDHMCLIETFLNGETLNEWKEKHKRKYFLFRKRFLMQLMNLLSNLHVLGILYVDIKPDNLMIIQDHVYLIDFDACVPLGSSYINLASRSNLAPETYEDSRKEASTDIFALGTLANTMYTKGLKRLWIRKCLRKDPNNRYQTIKDARRALNRIHYFGKIFPLCIILILSVFFTSGNIFSKKDLIGTYQFELAQKDGSRQEKAQDLLYEWILQERFKEKDFRDSKVAGFFLDQALLSGNTYIVQDIYERIPEQIKKELPIQTKIPIYMEKENIDYISIQDVLKEINQEGHGLNQLLHLSQLEKVLLDKEIVLEKKERGIITKIYARCHEKEIEKDIETFKEIIKTHLEYMLYLKSQGIQDIPLLSSWEKLISNDKTLSTLYEMLS